MKLHLSTLLSTYNQDRSINQKILIFFKLKIFLQCKIFSDVLGGLIPLVAPTVNICAK